MTEVAQIIIKAKEKISKAFRKYLARKQLKEGKQPVFNSYCQVEFYDAASKKRTPMFYDPDKKEYQCEVYLNLQNVKFQFVINGFVVSSGQFPLTADGFNTLTEVYTRQPLINQKNFFITEIASRKNKYFLTEEAIGIAKGAENLT